MGDSDAGDADDVHGTHEREDVRTGYEGLRGVCRRGESEEERLEVDADADMDMEFWLVMLATSENWVEVEAEACRRALSSSSSESRTACQGRFFEVIVRGIVFRPG